MIPLSTVMYVKDRLPNTIFINTNTSTKYNFSMPVSLNVENKTSIRLNGKNTIYSGEKVNIAGKIQNVGIVPIEKYKSKSSRIKRNSTVVANRGVRKLKE